jgi:hypothetical protein
VSLMRPGIKFRLWSPKFKNKRSVDPPGILRLVAALSLVSIIGVLVYSVAIGTTSSSLLHIERDWAIYVTLLHFILPFCVLYAVTTNSPASRILIATYFVILYSATLAGKGYLGSLPFSIAVKGGAATVVLVSILLWLYRSPKMRCYYALISDKPIPEELQSRLSELTKTSWLGPKGRARVEWILEHLETLILLGFIVAVFIALWSTSAY